MVRMVTTRWSPDTCDCIIDYEWDADENPNTRKHTVKEVIRDCGRHGLKPTKEEHYKSVNEENIRKNFTLDTINKIKPEITIENIGWEFDGKRVLHIILAGLSVSEKNQLNNNLKQKFKDVVVD